MERHEARLLAELKAQLKAALGSSDCKSFEKPQQV